MNKSNILKVEANVWLRNLSEFTKETVRFNDSKILQMTYDRTRSDTRSFILVSYTKEANRLINLKRPTLEQKKIMLLEFVNKLKEAFPKEFMKIGWYDLQVAEAKEEKLRWLALPVDKALLTKAKKEGRVVVIVRK